MTLDSFPSVASSMEKMFGALFEFSDGSIGSNIGIMIGTLIGGIIALLIISSLINMILAAKFSTVMNFLAAMKPYVI